MSHFRADFSIHDGCRETMMDGNELCILLHFFNRSKYDFLIFILVILYCLYLKNMHSRFLLHAGINIHTLHFDMS